MNTQRLKKIEEVFLAAVEVLPAERKGFLRESCGADQDLQREVESLLSFENTSSSFLDAPCESLSTEMFAESEDKQQSF